MDEKTSKVSSVCSPLAKLVKRLVACYIKLPQLFASGVLDPMILKRGVKYSFSLMSFPGETNPGGPDS